ncbi:MAG: carbamoyltransferase C-terminal domain-containing protein [Dissulfurispiraceae bacterium]|jgi:carbamoyltransferase
MNILGIWDGHDSGAAVVRDNRVLAAVNEERLSRRKLEIEFPERSIKACLDLIGATPGDIRHIAVSTSDFSKTLTRLFPKLKEEYYQIRRRKKTPGTATHIKKAAKYKLTEIGPSGITRYVSEIILRKRLGLLGFRDFSLSFIDHHYCHAAAAAFCSGFSECAVLTLDGIGDGLSGTISVFSNGTMERVHDIPGNSSLGIFFEHVTNLMNMRELEDEGKVMALATYSYPIDDAENPLNDFFRIKGTDITAKYSALKMFEELKKVLWRYPSEQFAWLAQRMLELRTTGLVGNIMKETGKRNLAVAGGVFSNVKANMLIRELPEVDNLFVFPHMGDGGLALGAAFCANYDCCGITKYELSDIFWGPGYDDRTVEEALRKNGLSFAMNRDIARTTAGLIATGEIVFWVQGRMEYGPRALGHRSILAPAGSELIKDRLNMELKMRVWYQPFCPSILEEDSRVCFEPFKGKPDRFMTTAYRVRPEFRGRLKGVTGKDGTCRPQMVDAWDGNYFSLLLELKKLTGIGVVLNTSLNLHGEPLVCSPEDAVKTFIKTNCKYMAIGNYLVEKSSI